MSKLNVPVLSTKVILIAVGITVTVYLIYNNYKPFLIQRIIKAGKISDAEMIKGLNTLSTTDLKYILRGGSSTIKPLVSSQGTPLIIEDMAQGEFSR